MKRPVVALALLTLSAASLAEPLDYSAQVRSRIGRATAPFYIDAIPEVESEFTQAISFLIATEIAPSPKLSFRLRVPMAPSLLAQPAGSYINARAFGNPEFSARRHLAPFVHGGASIASALELAVGLPFAGHGPASNLARNRVLAISAAMEGWRDQELYTPGVLPLTLRGDIAARRDLLVASASAELPLLFRVSGASIGDFADERPIGLTPNATLALGVEPARFLSASVAAVVASELVAPVEMPGGRVQLSLEPRITFRFLGHVELAIDAIFAIGGPLDGTLGVGFDIAVKR